MPTDCPPKPAGLDGVDTPPPAAPETPARIITVDFARHAPRPIRELANLLESLLD